MTESIIARFPITLSAKGRNLNVLMINTFFMTRSNLVAYLAKESDSRVPGFTIPQGLIAIAAMARQKHPDQFNFHLLDMNKELFHHHQEEDREKTNVMEFINGVLDRDVPFKPDVIGVSIIFSTGHSSAVDLAKCLKERWPDVPVVFGGHHATNYTDRLLNEESIDYVIRGQADYSFPDFLNHVACDVDPMNVPGVIKDPKAELSVSQPIHSMDELPVMAYDLLNMEPYINFSGRNLARSDTRSIAYHFSRGCPFKCTFCTSHTVHGRKMLVKSAQKSFDELEALVEKYNVNTIVVEDDLFGTNKKILFDFCDLLKASKLDLRFTFPNAFSVAVLTEEMIDRLVDIGMESAAVAVESGSEYVQKHIINKGVNLDKALQMSKYFRHKGIRTTGYFIMGFPGETFEMMTETRRAAETMEFDWAEIFAANPLVGSEMKEQLFESHVLNDEMFDEFVDDTDYRRRLYDTPEVSAADLEEYIYGANIEINFFQNINMNQGNLARAIAEFSDILSRYHFHIVGLACRARCYKMEHNLSAMEKDHQNIDDLIEANHPEAVSLMDRFGEQLKAFISETISETPNGSDNDRGAPVFAHTSIDQTVYPGDTVRRNK